MPLAVRHAGAGISNQETKNGIEKLRGYQPNGSALPTIALDSPRVEIYTIDKASAMVYGFSANWP